MSVILTRAAWKGLRCFLDDPLTVLTVDNVLALAQPLSGPSPQFVRATLDGETLSTVVTAYRRWSASMHLAGSRPCA